MTEAEPKVYDLQGQMLCLEEFIEALPEGGGTVYISRDDLLDLLKAVSVNIQAHGIADTGACVRNESLGFKYYHASGKVVDFKVEAGMEKGNLRTVFQANNFKGVSGRIDIQIPYDAEKLEA